MLSSEVETTKGTFFLVSSSPTLHVFFPGFVCYTCYILTWEYQPEDMNLTVDSARYLHDLGVKFNFSSSFSSSYNVNI